MALRAELKDQNFCFKMALSRPNRQRNLIRLRVLGIFGILLQGNAIFLVFFFFFFFSFSITVGKKWRLYLDDVFEGAKILKCFFFSLAMLAAKSVIIHLSKGRYTVTIYLSNGILQGPCDFSCHRPATVNIRSHLLCGIVSSLATNILKAREYNI